MSVVELAIPKSVCTHFLVPCFSSAIVSLVSLLVCMPDKSNYLKHILTTVRGSEIKAPPPCNLTRVLCWQSVTECLSTGTGQATSGVFEVVFLTSPILPHSLLLF